MGQSDLIANIVVLIVAVLAGLGGYFKSRKQPQTQENISIITGGVFNRHDTERLLNAIETCARSQDRMTVALASLADQRSHDMDDKLEQLVNKIDKMSARRATD